MFDVLHYKMGSCTHPSQCMSLNITTPLPTSLNPIWQRHKHLLTTARCIKEDPGAMFWGFFSAWTINHTVKIRRVSRETNVSVCVRGVLQPAGYTFVGLNSIYLKVWSHRKREVPRREQMGTTQTSWGYMTLVHSSYLMPCLSVCLPFPPFLSIPFCQRFHFNNMLWTAGDQMKPTVSRFVLVRVRQSPDIKSRHQ